MRNEEAIKVLKGTRSLIAQTNILIDDELKYREASIIAVEALEKQIPKKPTIGKYEAIKCPNGHNVPVPCKRGNMKWCPMCGQAIDWSEAE